MDVLVFLSAILATYAVSCVLVHKDGPYNVVRRLRASTENFGVLNCVVCISFYISLLITFIYPIDIQYFLAVWGATIIIDEIIERV